MRELDCTAVTEGPKHHFFGYYDRCAYSASGKYVLALEADFMDRAPRPDDAARIGIVDLDHGNNFDPIAETFAWNWQQGAMQQWLPGAPDHEIIYNTIEDGTCRSCIQNIHTGEKRLLPLPVYALHPSGREAVTVNFGRLHSVRPGYGYSGLRDPWEDELAPDADGIYRMDLETGEHEAIASLAQIAGIDATEESRAAKHWLNHLQYSVGGERIVFLHRWQVKSTARSSGTAGAMQKFRPWLRQTVGSCMWVRRFLTRHPALKQKLAKVTHTTRMFTASPDGSDLYLLNPDEMTSHFDWKDDTELVAWARRKDLGDHYYLFTDHTQQVEVVGEALFFGDGHCSYSPDRRFILTDTYPQGKGHERDLMLFNTETQERIDIGSFYSPRELQGEIRCDLHPRWNRDGTKVCFDSAHGGERQMHEIDVSAIVSP